MNDLRYFPRKQRRWLLRKAEEYLACDPLAETANLKNLRPNQVAQRELRLLGRYRVLFDSDAEVVTIVLVGEKRGNSLIVQREEFTGPHEDSAAE